MAKNKGLCVEFETSELKAMEVLVAHYYGNGIYSLKSLSDYCNAQRNILGCREWTRVAEVMAEAQKRVKAVYGGFTWEELVTPLWEKIDRLKSHEPGLLPGYATASKKNLAYFVLAIAKYRRENEPRLIVSSKNRYGL